MDTITITIPAVKINIPFEDVTFDTLEQSVFDTVYDIGRKAMVNALMDVDNALRQSRPKGALENTGKRERHFLTRLGDILYERTRYIDSATGNIRYLLEEKMRIAKNQRVSVPRSKMEMYIASLVTYRAAEKDVGLLTGNKRSHEAIRQAVIKESGLITARQKASIEKARRLGGDIKPAITSDIVYVESDSTFIRLQRKRKRKRPSNRPRKRKSIEVKLGIGYTDKIRRYVSGWKESLKLKDKFIYSSVGSGKTFMENLSLIAEERIGLSWAKTVIFGGDGGAYITAGIRDFFVGAIYILCKFHLKRNIKRCLASRPDTQDRINRLLRADRIDEALSVLDALMKRTSGRREKRAIRELYTYIDQNRDGINPLKHIEDESVRSKVIGAGAMESNIDKFLTHRFKKRGMSWSVEGALGLLKIKEVIANGEWDNWWAKGRDEKIIEPEPLKVLTAKSFWKKKKDELPVFQVAIPALQGPSRHEPWAKALKELEDIDYYKWQGM
jgi:hypothetical protein